MFCRCHLAPAPSCGCCCACFHQAPLLQDVAGRRRLSDVAGVLWALPVVSSGDRLHCLRSMTGVALEKVTCLRHAATMALIADIANNTGPILSIFRISCPMHPNARSIQSSFPHSLIFMSQYVTVHGSGLPKLGDVRHHFEIRVLAPRSQSVSAILYLFYLPQAARPWKRPDAILHNAFDRDVRGWCWGC